MNRNAEGLTDDLKKWVKKLVDKQDCMTCQNYECYLVDKTSLSINDEDYITPPMEVCIPEFKCKISQRLIGERQWSDVDDSEQYCLFYEEKK